jgi:hypothetical protein
VGIGFNVKTKNLEDDWEGFDAIRADLDNRAAVEMRPLTQTEQAQRDDKGDDGDRAQGVGIAMDVVGGALLVTGAVLLAIGIKRRRQGRQDSQARFRAAPNLGRNQVGMVLQGRF